MVNAMNEPNRLTSSGSWAPDRLSPQEVESLRIDSHRELAELQRLIAGEATISPTTSTPLDIYRPISGDWTPDLCLTTHLRQLDEQTANYHRYLAELAPAAVSSSDGSAG